MKIIFNIKIYTLLIISSIISASSFGKGVNPMVAIQVFAGNDTTICLTSSLPLSSLNAYITGDVDDGNWYTMGDGFFNPGGMNSVLFSTGSSYIPGPNDIVKGHFSLILVSFDPDGNGPALQVNDTVKITLQGSPTMICHNALNVSLGNNCEELVTPQMVVVNPKPPFSQYNLTLTDASGNIIPNNILTKNHLNQTISVNVSHMCGTTSCWGTITPQDKTPPVLQCTNKMVECGESISPDSIGFPVSPLATIIPNGVRKYLVKNLDACSDVTLSYTDSYLDLECVNGLQGRIVRVWTAKDVSNNTTTCTEVINIKTKAITLVSLPPNYNDNPVPSLECNGSWPHLPNGHPDPEFSGRPDTDGCQYLESTYTDVRFDLCGGSFKVLRKWLIVDWCTNDTKDHNQVIQIKDSTPPNFVAPDSIGSLTTPYNCYSERIQVPVIKNVTDCSEVDTFFQLRDTFKVSFEDHIKKIRDTFYIDSLPVGSYIGSYIVVDECTNKDTINFPITIIDKKAPFAICDQFTKVSISSSGTARIFANSIDDGSIDNCMIDSFGIAKMTDLCGGGTQIFRPYVDFCCAETASPVSIMLQVTDIYGNINTCMSQVTVEDKILPTISCPSHLTISCDYPIDFDNLTIFGKVVSDKDSIDIIEIYDDFNNGFAGSDGLALDNCSVNISAIHTTDIECSTGFITRTFTARDLFGNESKCSQKITLADADPFKYDDIVWPINKEIDHCDTSAIDDIMGGRPTFNNTSCALVESTYDDQYFFNTNEACIKILRNWTVIDWCQYDSQTGIGLYNYAQVIKLDNAIPPNTTMMCRDTVVCIWDNECSSPLYDHLLVASDDCSPLNALSWYWEIDIDNDGIVDVNGHQRQVSNVLPAGTHTVYAEVVDQCGNVGNCDYRLEVKDCKRPTPYCVSSSTTVIMPSSKEITIPAYQFDYDSYDNCTMQKDLVFSYSQNIRDSLHTYRCEDIANGISQLIEVTIWVTDEAGNQDFCKIDLILQDNNDVCQDVGNVSSISGSLRTFNDKKIEDASVQLRSPLIDYNQAVESDVDGNFSFANLPSNIRFEIGVQHHGSMVEEVSTFDLLLLQRHILDIAPLGSPYQLIAGDANMSGKLTVADLVSIRKVILGVTGEFAPKVPSWVFIDKDFVFPDPKNPWSYPESIVFENLGTNVSQADFIGVKIGDVNGSNGNLRSSNVGHNRTKIETILLSKENALNDIELYSTEDIISGFQIALKIDESYDMEIGNAIEKYTETNYIDGELRIICYLPHPISMEGSKLFSINSTDKIELSTNFKNELYHNYDEVLEIVEIDKNTIDYEGTCDDYFEIKIFNNQLNITYNSPETEDLKYHLFNIEGKLIETGTFNNNQRAIIQPKTSGLYIVKVENSTCSSTQKVFIGQ